ncbi:hypothetical protein BDV93DRAFT_611667 [Ceratobasidium sp. AG-I]|nr:hypothetical protein BDV93DRAFT_611667 [Ceratobasidium sp. AG-I]
MVGGILGFVPRHLQSSTLISVPITGPLQTDAQQLLVNNYNNSPQQGPQPPANSHRNQRTPLADSASSIVPNSQNARRSNLSGPQNFHSQNSQATSKRGAKRIKPPSDANPQPAPGRTYQRCDTLSPPPHILLHNPVPNP